MFVSCLCLSVKVLSLTVTKESTLQLLYTAINYRDIEKYLLMNPYKYTELKNVACKNVKPVYLQTSLCYIPTNKEEQIN